MSLEGGGAGDLPLSSDMLPLGTGCAENQGPGVLPGPQPRDEGSKSSGGRCGDSHSSPQILGVSDQQADLWGRPFRPPQGALSPPP